DIGVQVQNEANRSFPNDGASRYTRVFVLLIRWAEEDPKLPVSIELNDLSRLFSGDFGFQTETWQIPSDNSHNELSRKVLDFISVGNDDKRNLKIVYYGGHGVLTKGQQLAWTNIPDKGDRMFKSVKWSGIQNTLEEAKSDVLILLDCCASGTANTDEGRGTTELIAACGFNGSANPVGANSFTRALITELHLLRNSQPFTISFLFNSILRRIQMWLPEGRELQKAPLHVLLTQDKTLPQNIQINSDYTPSATNIMLPAEISSQGLGNHFGTKNILRPSISHMVKINSRLNPLPYLALHIWMSKSMSMVDFPVNLFSDWLRMMPILAQRVQVETGLSGGFEPLKLV
ncbi:hypothetical protein BKA65DRAFT_373259, partial [Rhexocercosporidium sp. MPI-PUGE-AT-0058]